jgi:hypothetical protein
MASAATTTACRCLCGVTLCVDRVIRFAVPSPESVHVAHASACTPAVEPRCGFLRRCRAVAHGYTSTPPQRPRVGMRAGPQQFEATRQRQTGSDRLSMGAAPPLLPRWTTAARMP